MYDLHNPLVRGFSHKSAKNLELVIAFVFASIRVQTSRLPELMAEYRKKGLKSSWIWGNKIKGLKYVRKHRKDLYVRMMKILKAKKKDCDLDLLMLFLEVPGLGLPKSGFVVQLVAGKAGCMDVHNLRKYVPEVDASIGTPNYFQTSGNSYATKLRKAIEYLDLTKVIGGCKVMWNGWCTDRSEDYPQHFPTPFDVSEVHLCIWK